MDIHWRNSMKPVRFFMFDARAALPVFILLVHARLYTLLFAMASMFLFWILEKRGLTFQSALRAFRCYLVGPARPAILRLFQRRMVDYG